MNQKVKSRLQAICKFARLVRKFSEPATSKTATESALKRAITLRDNTLKRYQRELATAIVNEPDKPQIVKDSLSREQVLQVLAERLDSELATAQHLLRRSGGKVGGTSTGETKRQSSAENGKKGGRPKKLEK